MCHIRAETPTRHRCRRVSFTDQPVTASYTRPRLTPTEKRAAHWTAEELHMLRHRRIEMTWAEALGQLLVLAVPLCMLRWGLSSNELTIMVQDVR